MICTKCKKEIPDNSIFCNFCGTDQRKTTSSRKPKSRGNGQGSVYKHNNKYRAEKVLYYYIDGNKRKRKTIRKHFNTKKDAIKWLATATEGTHNKDKSLSAIHELLINTEKYKNLGESKRCAYKIAWKKLGVLYARNIESITLQDLNAVINDVADSYYPKKDIKTLLKKIFEYAEINNYVKKNIANFIELPPVPKSKRVAFTIEEIKILYNDYLSNNVDEKQHIMVGIMIMMCFLGTRYGEISIIKKSDVDLEHLFMIGGIKTEAGKDRYMPIPKFLSEIFKDIYYYNKDSDKLIGFSEDRFYELWHAQINRLNLNPELTPHCCRHTYATVLAEADVQPAIITELIGHKSYSTTLQYTHITNKKKNDTIDNVVCKLGLDEKNA